MIINRRDAAETEVFPKGEGLSSIVSIGILSPKKGYSLKPQFHPCQSQVTTGPPWTF